MTRPGSIAQPVASGAGAGLGPVVGVEPTYEVIDAEFGGCIDPVSWLERLSCGYRWTEGPVWFADLRCLIFSDIPNQQVLKYDEQSGTTSVLRRDTGHANGGTRDRLGRLITCEQGARRVIRSEPDGSVTVLADSYRGRALNSPNDVVVKSDGTVWFTDPSYGIMSDYVGNKAPQEQSTNNVYRIDTDGSIDVVSDDFSMPNGLAFSPNESRLYIADSGYLTDAGAPRHLRWFDVTKGNQLTGGGVLAEVEPGIPDGVRVDVDGRLWVGAGDGVQCFSPSGDLLGKIRVPEATANLTFGGRKRNRLFITATSSLYAIYLNSTGAQTP